MVEPKRMWNAGMRNALFCEFSLTLKAATVLLLPNHRSPDMAHARPGHDWKKVCAEFGDSGILFKNDNKSLTITLNSVTIYGNDIRCLAVWDLAPGNSMPIANFPFNSDTLIYLAVYWQEGRSVLRNASDGDRSFDRPDSDGKLIHLADTYNYNNIYYQDRNVERTDTDASMANDLRNGKWDAYKDYLDHHGGVIQYPQSGLMIKPVSIPAYPFGIISAFNDDGSYDIEAGI